MRAPMFWKWCMITTSLLALILFQAVSFADDDRAEIEQRIEELSREAERTTDFTRLMEIASELMQLSEQLDLDLDLSPSMMTLSNTPDEAVNREILIINRNYREQKRILREFKDASAPQIPVLSARKLEGHIEVRGHNQRPASEPPYDGGIWRTLQYTIKERFVGYVTKWEYYDPKTGKYTDQTDYTINTISQKIEVPAFSGRECVRVRGQSRRACWQWEPYNSYQLHEGDQYPAIHHWSVLGSLDEGGTSLQVETPTVIFSTAGKQRSQSQGCTGARVFLPTDRFASEIANDQFVWREPLGSDSLVTPSCGQGSTLLINMSLCQEVPHCEQLQALLADVLWAIEMRDSYLASADVATSEEDLHAMVNINMNDRYPNLDLQDQEFLKEHAGGYNFRTGEIMIPNLCRGCARQPLCVWETEALRAHEQIHKLDVDADPELKRFFTDDGYRMATYSASEIARREAFEIGQLEHRAYDQQARYLMDTLQNELSLSVGCQFESGFYADLETARNALAQ